jgi:hypothetical protein
MGMFDWYEPNPPLDCPVCGKQLSQHWQGKDADCLMFIWQQGERHPVNQDVPDEMKWSLEELQLPEEFVIYNDCCGKGNFVYAKCHAPNGVWTETKLVTAQNASLGKNRKSDFKAYLRWLEGKKM